MKLDKQQLLNRGLSTKDCEILCTAKSFKSACNQLADIIVTPHSGVLYIAVYPDGVKVFTKTGCTLQFDAHQFTGVIADPLEEEGGANG